MPRGGVRPGAGRKRKRPYPGMPHPDAGVPGSPVKTAEEKLLAALPDLVDVAIRAARAGDKRMLVYCIDRILGTPIDRREQGEAGAFQRGYVIRLVRVGERDDADDAAAS